MNNYNTQKVEWVRSLETCVNMQLEREKMSKDASQAGRKVNQQSEVMVKPTTRLSKIHGYIFKKSLYINA